MNLKPQGKDGANIRFRFGGDGSVVHLHDLPGKTQAYSRAGSLRSIKRNEDVFKRLLNDSRAVVDHFDAELADRKRLPARHVGVRAARRDEPRGPLAAPDDEQHRGRGGAADSP